MTPSINTVPAYLSSIYLTIVDTPSLLNVYQSFTLAITLTTALEDAEYFIVNVPSTYRYIAWTLQGTSVCSNANYSCILISENQFRVTTLLAASFAGVISVTLTVSDNIYASPSTFNFPADQYFTVESFTTTNAKIDSTDTTNSNSQAQFSLSCSPNGKTCQSTNTSFCLSCY